MRFSYFVNENTARVLEVDEMLFKNTDTYATITFIKETRGGNLVFQMCGQIDFLSAIYRCILKDGYVSIHELKEDVRFSEIKSNDEIVIYNGYEI